MPHPSIPRAVAALWRRVVHTVETHDIEWLSTEELDPAVAELSALLHEPGVDFADGVTIRCVLGVVFTLRHRQDPDRFVTERTLALACNAAVYALRPHSLFLDDMPPEHASELAGVIGRLQEIERLFLDRHQWDRADLDRDIDVLTQAVDWLPPFREDHLEALKYLSELSRRRFEADPSRRDDLASALTAAAQIAASQEEGSEGMVDAVTLAATATLAQAHADASPDHLPDLIARIEQTLAAVTDPAHRAHLSVALSAAYGAQLELSGDTEEVSRRAYEAAEQASTSAALGSVAAVETAVNQAGLLTRAALRRPSDERFARAVTASRDAVAATAGTDPRTRAAALGNLSLVLRARFEHRFERQDLTEAIDLATQAVRVLPADHPALPGCYVNWVAAHTRRAETEPDPATSEAAVTAAQTALAAVPDDHPLRYKLLHPYALALGLRFNQTGALADLDELYQRYREAAALPVGDPANQALIHSGLCSAAATMAHRAIKSDDLAAARAYVSEALSAAERATSGLEPGDPRWTVGTYHAGRAHMFAAVLDDGGPHLEEALTLLATVLGADLTPAPQRLETVEELVELALMAERPAVVTDAYRAIGTALSELAFPGLSRASQERLLARWGAVTGDAAGWALLDLRAAEAVSTLERGRALLWSQTLELRTPLQELAEVEPALAAEAEQVRRILDVTEWDDGSAALPPGSASEPPAEQGQAARASLVEARMRAGARWREIREHPRMAPLLALPELDSLRQGIGDETVVYLTVNQHRSEALLLTAGDLIEVTLAVTPEEVHQRAADLMAVLDGGGGGPGPDAGPGAGLVLAGYLHELLAWLWDRVVGRVVENLDISGSPFMTAEEEQYRSRLIDRVVWCPTGPLALLPLHAAGHYQRSGPVPGRNALERMVSSYTSTLRALVRNESAPRRAEPAPMLVVEHGLGRDLGLADAPTLVEEYGITGVPVVLSGPAARASAATTAAVTAALERHDRVHFACHGGQLLDNPSQAQLRLADGSLRLREIRDNGIGRQFAFLAACSTSTGGRRLPDETLTMASAFQYAGWRRVIGTMWPVAERAAAGLTRGFYSRLGGGPVPESATAAALRDEVLVACRRAPLRPDHWAGYVHVGPTS